MLRLRTLGRLSLHGAGDPGIATLGRRPLALMALLAVAGARGVRRDKVIALLWPDSDEERARNSLSQALSSLRRSLGADAIVAGPIDLQLTPDVIASDVQEFEAALAQDALERAATLYEGPFLDGVHLRSTPDFEQWVDEQRARLARLHANGLERLARAAEEREETVAACDWWRRLSALDPTSASAALGLMRTLAAAGERATALQHYRVYEALLRQDVGAEPDDAVVAFAHRLRNGSGDSTREAPAVDPRVGRPTTVDMSESASLTISSSAPLRPAAGPAERTAFSHLQPRRRTRWVFTGALVAVAGVSIFAAQSHRATSMDERRVTVLPFRNLTGDSTLDALGFLTAERIGDGLQRSGLVTVIEPTTAAFITQELRASAATVDDVKEAAMVGDAVRAVLVVNGTYSRDGDSIVIVARLTDGVRNALVGVSEPVRVAASAPHAKLDSVSQRVLGMLAVTVDRSLADVRPVGSSSPPTLAAYSEYLEGMARFQRRAEDASLPFFERAYALDSTFVAPLVWQAFAAGGGSRRADAVRELAKHRERLGPVDRQALVYFEAWERRDIPGQILALERASSLAPGSLWTYNLGNLMTGLGRSDEAAAAFEKIDRRHGWLRLWPGFWRAYARALHYVDHERELEVVREARTVLSAETGTAGAWWVGLMLDEGRALAALGRHAELDRLMVELESARDPTRFVGSAFAQIGEELRSRGDTLYARRFVERSLEWFGASGAGETAPVAVRAAYARALYDAEHWNDAGVIFEQLQAKDPAGWDIAASAALCAARQGNRARALELMALIEAVPDTVRDPNPVVQSRAVYLSRVAAVLGDRDRAVRYIERLNDYTGGRLSRHAQHRDFENLVGYPPYERVTRATP